jgi:hypothetical protein
VTESTAKPEQAPDPHPEDPVGNNPVPVGHPAHEVWEDATQEALEEVFRLNERMLGRQPPSPAGLPFWTIELVVGKFQIWARRNLCVVRIDRDARAYEQWLNHNMQAWIDSTSGRLSDFAPELKAQLVRACNYWKGNAWAQVRAFRVRSKAAPHEEFATGMVSANLAADRRDESKGPLDGTPDGADDRQQREATSAQRTPSTKEQPSDAFGDGGPPAVAAVASPTASANSANTEVVAEPNGRPQAVVTPKRNPKDFVDDFRLRPPRRSYEKFAAHIGLSKDTLYAITKETRWVSDENYKVVASACGCKPEDLHPRDVPRPERRRS